MAWFFKGKGSQLGLSLSRRGVWHAYGTCAQTCMPSGGDIGVLQYVEGIEGIWSLHSSDAEEAEYDPAGLGLKRVFEQNDGRAVALIHYHHKDERNSAAVGASILMPSKLSDEVFTLFRSIIGNDRINYIITIDFIGLRLNTVEFTTIPSLDEFVERDFLKHRAYLSTGVSIAILGNS
ncbi:MAG TPA: hypothetical protein VNK48_01805 [Xanthobacteraceae bacterium]|nr:hypothetical protein [Xanthobacteraceae bacterium]